LAVSSSEQFDHLCYCFLPVLICHTYPSGAASTPVAGEAERRFLEADGCVDSLDGCGNGRDGGSGLNEVSVDVEAAVGSTPGAVPHTENVFGLFVLIHSSASFSSRIPKAVLFAHARWAPAHTAILFWKVLTLASPTSWNSSTRVFTTSMGVSWGTFSTHQLHSGSVHGFHDMGQDFARSNRHGASMSAGCRARSGRQQPGPDFVLMQCPPLCMICNLSDDNNV
jgi:hypothetical protein